jgi:hypothetical protein
MILDPLSRHDKSGRPLYIFKSILFFLLFSSLSLASFHSPKKMLLLLSCVRRLLLPRLGKNVRIISQLPLTHQKEKHNLSHWSSRLAPMAMLDPVW